MGINRNCNPLPQQSPTIRDPRYPTVKQWLEHRAKNDPKYRQPTGFALSERKAILEMQTYIVDSARKAASQDYYSNGQAR